MANYIDGNGVEWPSGNEGVPAPDIPTPSPVPGHSPTPAQPQQDLGTNQVPAPPAPTVQGPPGTIVSYHGHLIGRVDADGVVRIDTSLSETACEAHRLIRAGLLTGLDSDGTLM